MIRLSTPPSRRPAPPTCSVPLLTVIGQVFAPAIAIRPAPPLVIPPPPKLPVIGPLMSKSMPLGVLPWATLNVP